MSQKRTVLWTRKCDVIEVWCLMINQNMIASQICRELSQQSTRTLTVVLRQNIRHKKRGVVILNGEKLHLRHAGQLVSISVCDGGISLSKHFSTSRDNAWRLAPGKHRKANCHGDLSRNYLSDDTVPLFSEFVIFGVRQRSVMGTVSSRSLRLLDFHKPPIS